MVDYLRLLDEADHYRYLNHDSLRYESLGVWRRLVVWIINTFLAPWGCAKIDLIAECAKRSMAGLTENFLQQGPLSEKITRLKEAHAPLEEIALALLLEADARPAANIAQNLQNGQATTITYPAGIYPTLLPGGLGITREAIIAEYEKDSSITLTIGGTPFHVPRQLVADQGRGDSDYTQINGRPWMEVEKENFARRGEKAPPLPSRDSFENQTRLIERLVQTILDSDPSFKHLTAEQQHAHTQNVLYGLFFFIQTFEAPWITEAWFKYNLSPSAVGPRVYNLLIDKQKICVTAHLEGGLRIGDSSQTPCIGDSSRPPYSFESQRSSCITPDTPGDQDVRIIFRPVPYELLSYYLTR